MREDFSELRLPREIVEAFPPDRDALFDHVRPRVTDEMLAAIAQSDYGDRADEHLLELERIRAGIDLDRPIGWVPNEVLALFCWSEHNESRSLRPEEFHLARVFCCCALRKIPDIPGNRCLFDGAYLSGLVDSCLVLGGPYLGLLLPQITWSLEEIEAWDQDYLLHGFGLLAAMGLGGHLETREFEVVGDWLIRANREILPRQVPNPSPTARTFMDTASLFSGRDWQGLAARLQARVAPETELARFLGLMSRRRWLGILANDAATLVLAVPIVAFVALKLLWQKGKGQG
jgi:hypothetical protein